VIYLAKMGRTAGIAVVIFGMMAASAVSGIAQDEESEETPPASGSFSIGETEPYTPEGCWSDDDRVDPNDDSDDEDNIVMYAAWEKAPAMVIDEGTTYFAVISTNKGDMTFRLDEDAAPTTVNNFICLASNGYYNVTPFHRVIEDFMVQGGDPTGTGSGGPGYQFDDELPGDDLDYMRGTLAMANAGPDTQGAQFFIVHEDLDGALGKDYTILGQLVEGSDVLDDIADSDVVPSLQGEPSVPVEFLVVKDVSIVIPAGS
jgi:cyclophilin family peptidyl-prolyl cis-trans isomerase